MWLGWLGEACAYYHMHRIIVKRHAVHATSFSPLTTAPCHLFFTTLLMQDIFLRPFATGGASLQLGSFTRNVLDFTRVVAKLDMGLPAPKQLGPGEGMKRDRLTWALCMIVGRPL